MRIIVDANIIFSAILNTNGKIGDILLNSHKIFEFIAPRFLKEEIRKYHNNTNSCDSHRRLGLCCV